MQYQNYAICEFNRQIKQEIHMLIYKKQRVCSAGIINVCNKEINSKVIDAMKQNTLNNSYQSSATLREEGVMYQRNQNMMVLA